MNRSVLVYITLLFLLVCSCRSEPAQEIRQSQPPAFLADTESWVVTSSITKRRYQISVALPDGYREQNQVYPVLYAVDANAEFGIVVETARTMRLEKLIPNLVVVGIGYPNFAQGWRASLAPRSVDLTPTEDRAWEKEDAKESQEEGRPSAEGSRGAAGFFRFIREELIPSIEQKYRVSHDDRAFFGHSFGGLFGLNALFGNEGTFGRFILGSPSLWWDKRVTFAQEEAYAAKQKALPVRIFLSVGLLETGGEKYRMVENLRKFAEVLKSRNYDGLDLKVHFFEDETHTSVVPATVSKGLRFIYSPKKAGADS